MKEESAFFVNLLTRNVPTLCLITNSSQVGRSYHEQECVCLPARMWREGSVLEAGRLWPSNNYSCLDEVKFRQKPMKEASVYELQPTRCLVADTDTLLDWDHLSQGISSCCDTSFVPEIGDSSCPCCHLFSSFCFIFFSPHPTPATLLRTLSDLVFSLLQAASLSKTNQRHNEEHFRHTQPRRQTMKPG